MKGYSTERRRLWNAAYVDDCNLFSDSKEDIERGANAMYTVLSHLKMTIHPGKLELYVRCKNLDGESNIRVAGRLVPVRDRTTYFRAHGLYTNLKGTTERQQLQASDKTHQSRQD